MTALRARWDRLDTEVKRTVFVMGAWIALLHIAGLAALVAGSGGMIGAMSILDAIVLLFVGLWQVAVRLFPQKGKP